MSLLPALPIFNWSNRPAASSVNVGASIRVIDVGLPIGVIMTSDGVNWIPASPQVIARSGVAVSVTGTASETALATVTLPGNLLGPNGGVEIRSVWSFPATANTKTLRIKFGGNAYLTINFTTNATLGDIRRIRNRGSAASQIGSIPLAASGFGGNGASIITSAVDTTAAVDLVFSGQLGLTSETITLESYEVWLLP